MLANEKNLKVSVCVITYNQEKYIRQCLQSLVDQITDFDFEIIVGDDCSTDSTTSIIKEFANKYPNLIQPIYQQTNKGSTHNYLVTHTAAKANYVAHLDGDDYSLPGRLQTQADVLDCEPHCNMVFHRMLVEIQNRLEHIEGPFHNDLSIEHRKFYQRDLFHHSAVGWQSSRMYRKLSSPMRIPDFELIDIYTLVEQVADGYARFASHKPLGVYRMQVGITNNKPRIARDLTVTFMYFYNYYPQYKLEINTALLVLMLADAKHARSTTIVYFNAWLRTFQPMCFINFFRQFSMIRELIVKR